MTVTLRAGDAALTVDPRRGARWTSWRVGDLELLSAPAKALAPEFDGGCFVMAPIAGRDGRVDPPAIHGTAAARRWSAVDPERGPLVQRLTLRPDRLESELTLRAREPTEAWIGWHPYFARRLARGGDAEWVLEGGEQYARGADHLPTGAIGPRRPSPWDDAFRGFTAPPALRWPGALTLTVESSHDHFVLFDERPEVVCLEPQTGPPDAARLGEAARLQPGDELTLRVTWRWEPA